MAVIDELRDQSIARRAHIQMSTAEEKPWESPKNASPSAQLEGAEQGDDESGSGKGKTDKAEDERVTSSDAVMSGMDGSDTESNRSGSGREKTNKTEGERTKNSDAMMSGMDVWVLDFHERIGLCACVESLREAQLTSSDNKREAIDAPINLRAD
ncbi:hypothetical protein W97_03487 [Coniosporium apollinis CBS 100218]|uniref:Uncharacterized protein n=1 Tax=Coniosporium apollinis (strain CBS 100218) TaxID=1168221 RepID=R7YRI0_CONA1|nr:uncharacterized protein W97_03487 [Coniosporium apollinis CBS 100218]EON64256.1 hypothetical protein W97_03487 [Coniosporium apollinis CBS 100218]